MKVLAALLVCCFAAVSGEIVRFHGHEVLRVYPETQGEVSSLKVLGNLYDFWTPPRLNRPTDIQVGGGDKKALRDFLTKNGIKYEVMIDDLEQIINLERMSNVKGTNAFNLSAYNTLAEIHQFLDDISSQHPSLSEVIEIGKSTLGQPLRLIRIGANGGTRKKAYWIDGGIHAREWISPAVTVWTINELLTNNAKYSNLLEKVDFYILPVANADGYEFSRTSNRLWRKTRKNHSSIWGCIGADPNRNFDVHFGGSGTSSDKCSEIYRGPNAFSEPETAAMRDFIIARNSTTAEWKVYNSLHSYAQMILTPWGWTNALPDDYAKLRALGDRAAVALTAVHGTKYEVGSVTELLDAGAGGSDDWAYGSGLFEYSYTIEMRDTGRYGFVLPANQIVPTSEETFEAIRVMAESQL
ncbi:unnamed protein product [Allacma fusca]|uniref:Peptidase M14 domain-containing protein n=1 Tax=Allacma fusca TaxID=39272 RepID=A0A8J2KKD7_9HEXA|nr:unnamed protein product [Allacma fusca]